MTISYISIGSNLLSPLLQVETAIKSLKKMPKSNILAISKYYRTSPLGSFSDQPDFLNAVLALETELDAYTLLDNIQHIELNQGRNRNSERWSPRTIDLDLMLFGNETIHNSRLIIPHYDMYNRGFMLWPLFDIVPELRFPNGKRLKSVLLHLGEEKPSLWEEYQNIK